MSVAKGVLTRGLGGNQSAMIIGHRTLATAIVKAILDGIYFTITYTKLVVNDWALNLQDYVQTGSISPIQQASMDLTQVLTQPMDMAMEVVSPMTVNTSVTKELNIDNTSGQDGLVVTTNVTLPLTV